VVFVLFYEKELRRSALESIARSESCGSQNESCYLPVVPVHVGTVACGSLRVFAAWSIVVRTGSSHWSQSVICW
jgi:hypothetical protein